MTLPAGFAVLQPFVTDWTGHNSAERDALRNDHSAGAKQAFYDAMHPQIVPLLDYLDAKPIAEFDAGERQLMLLALAYAHVAQGIEVQGPDEEKHGVSRRRLPITRAPADA